MVASPKMFASMFTMSVFLIFGYCLTTICYLAYDPDSRFFIGRWPLWGLLWVPLFGVAHWWHLKKQRPVRSVMMACVFGPATTYFIIGWVVLHKATHLHTVLRSSDCSRTEEFKQFNEAALAARAFHNKCLAENPEPLLIHYCPGYEDEKWTDNRAQTWEYLKYAEHNYGCAGFCNVAGDPSMWTYQGYQDSCAAATAGVMRAKISALAFQMMVYSIIVVVMFLLWIEVMSPTLKAMEKGISSPTPPASLPAFAKEEKPPPAPIMYSAPLPQPVPQPVYAQSSAVIAPPQSLPPPTESMPRTGSFGGSMGPLNTGPVPGPRSMGPLNTGPAEIGGQQEDWTVIDNPGAYQSMPPMPSGAYQSMPPMMQSASMPPMQSMPPSMPPMQSMPPGSLPPVIENPGSMPPAMPPMQSSTMPPMPSTRSRSMSPSPPMQSMQSMPPMPSGAYTSSRLDN